MNGMDIKLKVHTGTESEKDESIGSKIKDAFRKAIMNLGKISPEEQAIRDAITFQKGVATYHEFQKLRKKTDDE